MKRLVIFVAWLIPVVISLAALFAQVNADTAFTNARSWVQPVAWVPAWLYGLLTSPWTLSIASSAVGYLFGRTLPRKVGDAGGPLPSAAELARFEPADAHAEAVADGATLLIAQPAEPLMDGVGPAQRVSEHDKALFASIDQQFSDGLLAHLREHDFANDVHKSKAQALWEISYWEGARYHFVDSTIQAAWSTLFDLIGEFNNLQSESLVATRNSADFFTIHHLGRPRYPIPDSVRAEIKALNEMASELERGFNEFASLARRRLVL